MLQFQNTIPLHLCASLLYELSQHTFSTLNMLCEHTKVKEYRARGLGNLNSGTKTALNWHREYPLSALVSSSVKWDLHSMLSVRPKSSGLNRYVDLGMTFLSLTFLSGKMEKITSTRESC